MNTDLAATQFCCLTTEGRTSRKPHTIEIWFALVGSTFYLSAESGEKADWVRNLRQSPEVSLRVNDVIYACTARVVEDAGEDKLARKLLVEKYQPGYEKDLTDWGRTSMPVALETELPLR